MTHTFISANECRCDKNDVYRVNDGSWNRTHVRVDRWRPEEECPLSTHTRTLKSSMLLSAQRCNFSFFFVKNTSLKIEVAK